MLVLLLNWFQTNIAFQKFLNKPIETLEISQITCKGYGPFAYGHVITSSMLAKIEGIFKGTFEKEENIFFF